MPDVIAGVTHVHGRVAQDRCRRAGEAELVIERRDERIVFALDGEPMAAGACDVPIARVVVSLFHTTFDKAALRTTMGTLTVDALEVSGVRTMRRAYVID